MCRIRALARDSQHGIGTVRDTPGGRGPTQPIASDPMIRFEDVTKRYADGTVAVDDLSQQQDQTITCHLARARWRRPPRSVRDAARENLTSCAP